MARTATIGTALRTFPRECFRGFIGSFPGFNRALRICAICALTWAGAGCSAGYILRAGWEEARILTNRRPIQAVLRDTTVDALTRDKLRLVLDVRDFAVRDLGLRAGNSYRDFTELDRDTLALQVMAAAELDLTWKMWNFPIVGALPYKAWFDFDRALAEAEALRREGWDVRVSPVSAFSTLGWFPDPILSPTLRADSVSLANTVIHEILHSTYYPTGQADFNESFANFVGYRGAIAFFCDAVRSRPPAASSDPAEATSPACATARQRWEDARIFGRFFQSVAEPLRAVYDSGAPDPEKRIEKRQVFADAAARWEAEYREALGGRFGSIDPGQLDNAWVIARLLYYRGLDDFETVYARHGELMPAVWEITETAEGRDPWEALQSLLAPDESEAR